MRWKRLKAVGSKLLALTAYKTLNNLNKFIPVTFAIISKRKKTTVLRNN